MLEKIKDLIFGLNDYEKTRIELRFKEVLVEIQKISISKIENFETLEKIIYKIKEELRIKSSNLNKVISNPERNLTKKNVKEVLDVLEKKKYDFLEHAFKLQEKYEQPEIHEELHEIEESQDVVEEMPEIKQDVEEKFSEIEEEEINLDILKNKDYEVKVENGKVPYILINFFKEVDYVFLKNISALFFESYNMQGSNIIVEDKKALIIPRNIDDNLINLPRIESNLDEVYSKLKKDKDIEPVTEEEYNEIVHEVKAKETTTTKKQDDSLDSLLQNIEQPIKPIKEEKQKEEKIEIIHDNDKVEIEKEKKDEIKIEDEKISIEKEELPKETIEKIVDVKKENKYEVYKDDKIVVYLNENSKVFGEIVIESINHDKINDLDQNTLTYMSIFSKVFASIIFETLEAHGTNLIWDFENTKLRIIPRYQGDEIKNLNWEKKENTEDFLEQVRNKLHLEMSKELPQGEKPIESQEESPIRKDESSLKEKGNYVLNELRRLP